MNTNKTIETNAKASDNNVEPTVTVLNTLQHVYTPAEMAVARNHETAHMPSDPITYQLKTPTAAHGTVDAALKKAKPFDPRTKK
jgi:hypothetical protein